MTALDQVARHYNTVFLKIEPGYDVASDTLQQAGFRLSPQTVQPPRTLILDINGQDAEGNIIDESAILKRMNQGTRRNIRKSEKNGISVRLGTRADMQQFNHLLAATSQRQGFGVHVPTYYERIYDLFIAGQTPVRAALLMASYLDETTHQPRDLSGALVFVLGTQSWYLYGASSDEEHQRMASFGVQWAAVQWARAEGAAVYDMYGVPDYPPDVLESQFEARGDGLWGVYRFKRGWGGRIIRTVGAWDRVYLPPIYWAYQRFLNWRVGGTEA
jgi:peptidoglycan pentaglycine glycine transferase (the first glycine)